jgi:hypothetical protein
MIIKFNILYCTSYSRPLLFPLPWGFGLWNLASSVRWRKKFNFVLFSYVLSTSIFCALFSYLFHALLWLRACKREKSADAHLCREQIAESPFTFTPDNFPAFPTGNRFCDW